MHATISKESASAVRPDVLPIQAIDITDVERSRGGLDPDKLNLAAAILSMRGYVILKDALRPDFAAQLGREMQKIYEDCQATHADETAAVQEGHFKHNVHTARETRAAFWFRKARWRIFPKLTGVMADPQLLANPFVIPILRKLLGPRIYCNSVSSDTCLKGSLLQSPHTDAYMEGVFEKNAWRARGFVVNVPTMECGLHNGPIEVWPGGSHMWDNQMLKPFGLEPYIQDGRNPPVEALAQFFPSIKVSLSPGEIMIRDLAMWHRGTPNPTDSPRTMLTIGIFRSGYKYGYGDPSYNVDEEIFRQLAPSVRSLFAYYFTPLAKLRRAKRRIFREKSGEAAA